MSHNSSGGHVPYISSHTSTVSAAGVQNILITGFGLSPATSVVIDSNLGTLVSQSYAKASATSGTITLSVNAAAPPAGAPADRTLTVSHGGYPVQGTGVTGSGVLTVQHGFSPTDIASLQAWYDASDASSITKDSGDLVSQWSDKSGNGFHATQSTGANQPKYFASGGGIGQEHVSLGHDGAALSWFVISPSMTWATVSSGGYANCSVFAVLHWPGTSVGGDILRQSNGNNFSVNANYGIHFWAVNSNQAQGGTAGGSLPAEFLAGWFWTDSGFITRLNGSVDDTDSSSPVTSAQTSASNVLGLNFNTGTDMEISELLIFNTELTGTDLSNVEDYLNAKWSIWT